LPPELLGTLWGGRYRGQRQAWLLLRFNGQDDDVVLDAHDPAEFCEWKWVEPDQLPTLSCRSSGASTARWWTNSAR
jgi:putative (di)nucleoside polyphosphate hydrolase